MRKVVTGEQVAQMYNRDPFALPVWRAPVYQTPAGIILLVKLARLLAWLVRLIVRHPAAARILALLALTWINPGWVGLVAPGRLGPGDPGGLAVLLAVLLHPLGRPPRRGASGGPGGLPAPLGRGNDHRRARPLVSGPHPAARPGQGHRHPLHRPGPGPARLRPVRGRLRQAGREPGARVRRDAVPGPHRPVRSRRAGVRPPRRPGRSSSPPSLSPTVPTSKPCRSAGARTVCPGW